MSEESKPQQIPGTICWSEISTPDLAGTIEFYTSLMGWTTEDMDLPNGMTYTMFKQGETMIGGCVQPEGEATPMWMNYILVEDLDAAIGKAIDLGATNIMDRVDLPMGSFAVISDPQGAVIAFWENHENGC